MKNRRNKREKKTKLCNKALDATLQFDGISTNNPVDLLSTLEEDESRHGANTQIAGGLGQLVDVDLVELGLRVGLAELGHPGRDHLAGTAPRREAVQDNCVLRRGDLSLELGVPVPR